MNPEKPSKNSTTLQENGIKVPKPPKPGPPPKSNQTPKK